MESKGYIVIQDWMLDLPLNLVETTLYAIVYGFSQDGESAFCGSLSFLARKCKCSKDTARRALHELVDKGYIQRIEVQKNGVHFNDYKVCDLQGEVANCKGGGSKLQPHNKEHNKDRNKTTNKRAAAFVTPTLTEIEDYCRERQNSVDAERFLNYYEANGWMVGRNKMKDWKAAVRTWEQRENARPVQPKQKQSRTAYYNELAAQIMGGLKND